MARKKLMETENVEVKDQRSEHLSQLSILVERWGKNKKIFDPLKKEVDNDGKEIKELMLAEKLDTSSSGEFTACLSFSTKELFDEEGLVTYLTKTLWGKKKSACPYVKTVEIVDWDAIEKAIYNGEITKDQVLEIDKFKTVTKTPVLKLGKQKKEK